MSEVVNELLKQTQEPMKPVKRSELLGWKGRRPSLDDLEAEG